MTDASSPFPPTETATLLADAPEFTPVPMARSRHDGWTPERQRMFIAALSATGTVDSAARSVGMTRMAAYNLRKRDGAESFADAWERAIDTGRARVFDYAMDRALNGVTTLRLRLGGTIDISHGPDKAMITTMLKSPLQGHTPHHIAPAQAGAVEASAQYDPALLPAQEYTGHEPTLLTNYT